jgi:hypothetical protein
MKKLLYIILYFTGLPAYVHTGFSKPCGKQS